MGEVLVIPGLLILFSLGFVFWRLTVVLPRKMRR